MFVGCSQPHVNPPCGRPPEQWEFLQMLWSQVNCLSTGSCPLESEVSIAQKGFNWSHVEITTLGNKAHGLGAVPGVLGHTLCHVTTPRG